MYGFWCCRFLGGFGKGEWFFLFSLLPIADLRVAGWAVCPWALRGSEGEWYYEYNRIENIYNNMIKYIFFVKRVKSCLILSLCF